MPTGFVVERVADDLEIRFPMFGAFADDGRLFVAESSGRDLHAELKAGARNSRIRVLDDVDGDGRFDTAQVFVDKLVCPMGLAWRDGKLYVADPPDVVVFTDDDADGRADERKVILSGFGHATNGSLHGLVFGPDGLLYMTMGSPDGYALKRADGTILEGDSGALIRSTPEGRNPEVLCRGFVNLIEVAFTARGDIIGTDNWFQQPAGGIRDALVHLVDGGLYPYLADTGTRYPMTGIQLPPVALYPAVAVSGLVCYEGRMFPDAMRGNLFTAQFNARKVVRHALVPSGSTFRTADEDFVTTDDPDFHPSDVVESADGSLIVIDTGSWYVQHCPTGRIRDVEAPGGIYRVRFAATPQMDDPWGKRIHLMGKTPEQLAELLNDPRPVVRKRAERALGSGGPACVRVLIAILERSASVTAKQHAIWALAANGDASAIEPLRKALDGTDANVVITAIRALASRGDYLSSTNLERLLIHRAPAVRLAAAEALARVGNPSAIPVLWEALGVESDPFVAHAVVHAAHRLADHTALQQALKHPNPKVQTAALRLLDQPPRPSDALDHAVVISRLDSRNTQLRRAAREILAGHPEWAGHAVDFLRALAAQPVLSEEDLTDLADLVLAFQDQKRVQEVVAAAVRNEGGKIPDERRAMLLGIISRSTLANVPRVWIDALVAAVESGPPEVRLAAVRCASVLRIRDLDDRLDRLANSPNELIELRREALRAIVSRRPTLGAEAFRLLLDDLSNDTDPLPRLAAGEVFGNTRLDRTQLAALLHLIQGDALITPSVLLPMLERSTTLQTAPIVLDYLEGAVGGGWRPPADRVENLFDALGEPERTRLESALQAATRNTTDGQTRLAKFIPLLERGNAARRRAVFLSNKVACSTCHRVGSDGGQIGPDLTTIGATRAGRDIIESIVFPSSTIAQEFEQYAVITQEGRVISGIMARQAPDTIVLRDSSGAETRLRRDEIAEMNRQTVSMMPEGLERHLTQTELRDLLAYLQSLR
ncbi:MAG: PVC-type heme-binding CxxCH protein [Pirellulales bacterium]